MTPPRQQTGPATRIGTWKPATHLGGPLPDLAWAGVCRGCERTFISVVKPFPSIYRCPDCQTERDAALERATAAYLATRPFCRHGHPLTVETLYVSSAGTRQCRVCRNGFRRRRARQKRDLA